ncbi:hypothetical protein HDU76_014111 [Blyttiomyces sp. JEL0837]|nr:hypothetical protein HDU76_014111 [Blyttiomyces sp. JEL0837]
MKQGFHSNVPVGKAVISHQRDSAVTGAHGQARRVSIAETATFVNGPGSSTDSSHRPQDLPFAKHIAVVFPADSNTSLNEDGLDNMQSLPNPDDVSPLRKSTITTIGRKLLYGSGQRLSAIQERYPISTYTLQFRDASLEMEYCLLSRYQAIHGDIVTASCLLVLIATIVIIRWLNSRNQQSLLQPMIPGLMFTMASFVPFFVTSAIVPWDKLKHFHLWLFYFAVVGGGSVLVYVRDTVQYTHLNGVFMPAVYPGKEFQFL